jgi:hypothetical protein
VNDVAGGYGEPGYSTSDYHADATTPRVVLGDYWCQCNKFGADEHVPGRGKLHSHSDHHPRLWAQLEQQGVNFEWYDEWAVDHDYDKAYRTEADSYSWQRSFVWTDDGEMLTPDDEIATWLEWATNEPTRCLMRHLFSDAELETEGFVERSCEFENGWYGQEDNPQAIYDAIREREPDTDILFKLADVEQFRVTFCVYVRESEGDQ